MYHGWPTEVECETKVINNGQFVVVYTPDFGRNEDGTLKSPPKLLMLWYDLETETARAERIPFKTAELLNPKKYAEAMLLLEEARHKAAVDAAIEKEEQ